MRMTTRALASVFFLLATAGVSAQTADPVYDILFDLDRNAATGCAASPTGSAAFGGYERRLRATLDPTTLTVDTVEVETCDGTFFQPLMPLGAGQPAGLNNGIDGTDVIELAVTIDALNLGNATLIDLAFAADSGAGSDILATQNGAPGGPPILLGLPVSIPTLSALALLLLAALVVAVAWRAHRRAGQLSAVGMVLLVAVVAWAMNFMADGDVSDWSGFSPAATDPNGDSTDGNSGIDLRAAFYAIENGALFFRIDLTDVENQAPVATDDVYVTVEDTPLEVGAPGVLFNDSDADGDPITAVLQTGPTNAQAFVLNADGSFDYTPNADFNGTDSFTYVANDGQADSNVATVTLAVNAVNDPPVVNDDTASTLEDDPVVIAVLGNDSDIDGALAPASVSISTPPTNGTAVPNPATGEITYTKTGDFNGMDSFVYEVCDDGTPLPAECGTATVEVEVRSVNDAPSFTPGADPTVLEDAGAQTVPGWATAISAGPPDEAGQVLTFNVTGNDNPALFAAAPAIDATSGDLSFTPADDANGSASITITLSDDGGTADGGVDTSAPVTFTITVTAVNDAPGFTPGMDASVLEDSGAYSQPWASAISAGPADESGQVVSFNVTGNDNPALFSAAPAVAADGTLSFTPAADAFGIATITVEAVDDGGAANGGVDTSPPASFTITIEPVNDSPSFAPGGPVTALEDAGPQTVASWAVGSPGPANEAGQTLTYNVTANDNAALFAAGPAIAADGTLSFTPAADANGTANVTVTLSDDGGTANGGVDTTAPATFAITVVSVNDAPSFAAGPDIDVLENTGAFSQAWATGLSAGPANEAGQALSFTFTGNTNPMLFASGPSLAPDGTLSFTPAAGLSGSADLTVTLMDDGGTANGGIDSSPPVTFTINVLPVNDPPTFVAGPNEIVNEDSGAQIIGAWATGINDGDGGGQVLTFNITGNTAPALFSAGPTVDPVNGNLSYTPAANAYGTATITLTLSDDGGTANGGVDTSAPQSFDITINPINDAPTAPATASFAATTNIQIDVPAGSGLLVGAADEATEAADPAGPGMPGTNLSVGNAMNPAPTTTTNGGNLTINADGSFRYNPPAGFTGSDSFSYVVCDDGIGAPGPQCSAPVNVTLTVSGPTVWFIDNSVSGGSNDGRLASPFESLAAYNASMLPGVGDFIFVATGSGAYSDAFTAISLDDDQTLFGQGTTGVTFDGFTGITAAPNSIARPTLGGMAPLLQSSIIGIEVSTSAMASNTVRGLTIGDTPNGIGISGSVSGTLNISEVDITGTGSLMVIDGGTTGTLNASFGTLSSSTATTSSAFRVTDMAGGSVSAANTTITMPLQGAILIRQTPTMQFDFGNLGTVLTTGGAGIVTENPGTVTISPPSPITIQTVGGPALDLNGGTYTGFNFASLSSNNAATGIRLANTGGFISSGSGTIQNTSGDAVVIDGGSNSITLGTFITNAAGRSVSVTNHTGGNVVFNRITDTGSGVFLNNNTGTSFFFAGTMNLNTGTNDAFVATGGGSLDATGTGNTIQTSTGTAVRLNGVDIRNTDFTMRSVSSSGATNAIVLNMTGGAGDFVVTGDGSTPGSGGTIQGASGNAIALTDTGNVDLRFMNIQNSAANGVFGSNVTNFRLEGVTLFGNGDAVNEGALRFDNLLGTASIVDSTLTGSAEHNIEITNTMGTLSPLTISNSTIGANSATLGADGLLLETRSTATADVVVIGSTFNDNRSDGIQINAIDASAASLTVNDSTFTSSLDGSPGGSIGARGIVLSAATNADLSFDIGSTTANLFENFSPNIGEEAINVTAVSTSTILSLISGRINNNTFTNSGGAVGVDARGNGALVMEIDSNTANTSRQAIDIITGDLVGDAAIVDMTITNNTLTVAGTVTNPNNEAIGWLGDRNTANCMNLRGNNATASGTRDDILLDDFTSVPGSMAVESGASDCGGACPNAEAHLLSNNAITDAFALGLTLVAPGTCATVP